MIKYILDLFRKKPLTLEDSLLYPEGKRIYKETHNLKKTQFDEDALKIIHRLNKFGHKSFLVGGCVRDLLLGKKPKDFDIATSATPTQIKNAFNNCRIIGKRFKIVHIIFKGKIIEVTTFRSLPDHRLNTKSANSGELLLKRDNNYGNAKEDAARRDFTVNALYYDPRNESIIDYVGGFEDIQQKILRVVGDPDISFKEDPVRMLRAVKISILHGLKIEKKTQVAIKKNKFEIEKASTSRMLEEYNKIFRTWETAQVFKGLAENHLLEVLFKEALEIVKKQKNWQDNFLDTSLGKLLLIADRKLKEREELTPTIFFALLFSDIVNDALQKEKGNMVATIKTAIDPICNRLEIAKRDRERLIRIYASQKRFLKTSEVNAQQNNLFRAKDFFYDAFMYFKLMAESTNDQDALQVAFFWEISARIRPDGKGNKHQHHSHVNPHTKKGNKDGGNKQYPEENRQHKDGKRPNHNKQHPKNGNRQKQNIPIENPEESVSETPSAETKTRHAEKHVPKDISILETTKIVTTAEMEALEAEIPEEEKLDANPSESVDGQTNPEKKPFQKRKFRPNKKRRFFKKKNFNNQSNQPKNTSES